MQLAFITLGMLQGFLGWWLFKGGKRNAGDKDDPGSQKVPPGAARLKTSFPPCVLPVDFV